MRAATTIQAKQNYFLGVNMVHDLKALKTLEAIAGYASS